MNGVDFNKLVIAALLHDIGKFMMRTEMPHHSRYNELTKEDYGRNGAHAKWSADFVSRYISDETIEDLVLYHHNPGKAQEKRLAKYIQDADHFSSAMDRTDREGEGKVKEEPLKSIFPLILQENSSENAPDMYYPLETVQTGRSSYPVRREQIKYWKLTEPYRVLWDGFISDVEIAGKDLQVGTLLYILKKHTSKIPSAVYKNEPDIPLFDHAKTTAAIAHCLAASDNAPCPFLLIQGDLSGIQDFIFNVMSPAGARKGMAKRLRGRSFWLSLLMDAASRQITKDLGLFEPSVLWNTGGNFLILAPNTESNRKKTREIIKKVNQGLLDTYGGRLALNIAVLEAKEEDIKDFSRTIELLRDEMAVAKTQKFLDCTIPFLPETGDNLPVDSFCPACGSPTTGGIEGCHECGVHQEIGTKLASARYILTGTRENGFPIRFSRFGLDACYLFTRDSPQIAESDIFTINSTELRNSGNHTSGFLYIGNVVPKGDDGKILSFQEIAQLSKGTPKLGFLKADVDNLGKIFSEGIPDKQRSISRIHTLSDQIAFFFSGELNRICSDFVVYGEKLCPECRERATQLQVRETDEEDEPGITRIYYQLADPCPRCVSHGIPKFYITYSGGDDLFIAGPWDATLELADRIYSEFRLFTCENPGITLSAGVEIVSPRLPVSRAVQYAEENLEAAKNYDAKKNRISVFSECLKWKEGDYEKDYTIILNSSRQLERFVETENKLSRSTMYSLLHLWKQTYGDLGTLEHDEALQQRIARKRFLPHLKYLLKRNIRDRTDREDVEQLVLPLFPWINIPVYWTSLRLRTKDVKI